MRYVHDDGAASSDTSAECLIVWAMDHKIDLNGDSILLADL